jgi:hypothetical protein
MLDLKKTFYLVKKLINSNKIKGNKINDNKSKISIDKLFDLDFVNLTLDYKLISKLFNGLDYPILFNSIRNNVLYYNILNNKSLTPEDLEVDLVKMKDEFLTVFYNCSALIDASNIFNNKLTFSIKDSDNEKMHKSLIVNVPFCRSGYKMVIEFNLNFNCIVISKNQIEVGDYYLTVNESYQEMIDKYVYSINKEFYNYDFKYLLEQNKDLFISILFSIKYKIIEDGINDIRLSIIEGLIIECLN